jgi:hypothetical protein
MHANAPAKHTHTHTHRHTGRTRSTCLPLHRRLLLGAQGKRLLDGAHRSELLALHSERAHAHSSTQGDSRGTEPFLKQSYWRRSAVPARGAPCLLVPCADDLVVLAHEVALLVEQLVALRSGRRTLRRRRGSRPLRLPTPTCTCTHASAHARTHARTHALTHACTHARTHARMHASTYARTRARAPAQSSETRPRPRERRPRKGFSGFSGLGGTRRSGPLLAACVRRRASQRRRRPRPAAERGTS